MHCVCSFLSGEWSSPVITGTPPPPLYGFSFILMGRQKALLVGGSEDIGYNNDVYCFDIGGNVSDSGYHVAELCGMGRYIGGGSCIGELHLMCPVHF